MRPVEVGHDDPEPLHGTVRPLDNSRTLRRCPRTDAVEGLRRLPSRSLVRIGETVTEPALTFDPDRPDPARRYDRWLGGKDNFAADRRSADEIKRILPSIEVAARENRKFLHRAVHYLAADCGIRQFLDIGTGLPMSPNVHEVAQTVDPACRVVYVDHEPLVGAHARALLTSTPPGVSTFLAASLLQPKEILASPILRDTLDLTRPVGLLLVAVLHFIVDSDQAGTAVRELISALPPGSYVVLSHATVDPLSNGVRQELSALARPGAGHGPFRPRSYAELAVFLDSLDMVEPGLVSTVRWRPDRDPAATEIGDADAVCYAAVARLPGGCSVEGGQA
jgi:hypothetical protein